MKRALPLSLFCLLLAAPAQAATSVKRYEGWNSNGDPQIKRYVHGDGECTQASGVTSRADAWRCTSGSTVLDPCFLSPTDEEVLCVTAPWTKRGYLLSALIEPDTHGNSSGVDAWALRVGRRRCTYIANRRPRGATYRCGGRKRLFGRPNRRKKTWTIRIGSNRRNARRARVKTAWI